MPVVPYAPFYQHKRKTFAEGDMEMMVRKEENAVIISVTGRMDAVAAPQFDKRLETLMTEGDRRIIIDFKNLEYISSAGLQTILAAAKKLEQVNGEIVLLHLSGAVKEVFEISGFDTIFRVFDDQDAALA
jgi:stage II sporulation protein AA (anti-sigma F factor antagonist)